MTSKPRLQQGLARAAGRTAELGEPGDLGRRQLHQASASSIFNHAEAHRAGRR